MCILLCFSLFVVRANLNLLVNEMQAQCSQHHNEHLNQVPDQLRNPTSYCILQGTALNDAARLWGS